MGCDFCMVMFGICPSVCVFVWADIIYVLVHVGCLFCVVTGSGGFDCGVGFRGFRVGLGGVVWWWLGGGLAPFLVLWVVLCVDILDVQVGFGLFDVLAFDEFWVCR